MATYAKCGWIFNNHFTVNLQRNLNSREKIENLLRFSRIMAMSLWSHFFGPRYVSVCVCHKSQKLSKRPNELSWVWALELSSTYPTLCCMEIWVLSKIRALLSGTLSQILDLENFAMASRSYCQQNSSVADASYSWTHLQYSSVYYTSVHRIIMCSNSITSTYFDSLWICSRSCAAVNIIQLIQRLARSVCGSRASCCHECCFVGSFAS